MVTSLFLMIAIVMQANCEIIKLVLVRNGESEWSKQNLFTGWTDVPLSNKGHEDAIRGGKLLREKGYKFDICYTSFLKRAIHTAIHLLDEIDQLYIPMFKSLHLNGRHYGALQGLNKKDITEKYGLEQVNKWRKSFSVPPPPLEEKDERNPANQEQYKNYQKNNLPLHESLKDTTERVVSFYNEVILPEIKSGKKVLITAHSNSLKALIKYLDDISEDEIVDLTIQSNNPLVYEFDYEYKPIKRYYLDDIQEDINSKIKAIKNKDSNSNLKIIMVDKLSEEQEKGVWEIIKDGDYDFVPPLSEREDTVHKFKDHRPDASKKKNNKGLIKFFEEIKKESFVLILNNGKIEGFMSFIKDYRLSLNEGDVICEYITIIIINKKCRNKGYTQKMYDVILNRKKDKLLGVRTWSTNKSHRHILGRLGFKLVQTDINDRGVNIDTVYYLKYPEI